MYLLWLCYVTYYTLYYAILNATIVIEPVDLRTAFLRHHHNHHHICK